MRLSRLALGVAFCLLPAAPLAAQQPLSAARWADSVRARIDDATRHGGTALDSARRLVNVALRAWPNDPLLQHYQGFVLYRILYAPPEPLTAERRAAYLQAARTAFERSIARRPLVESYLLLAEIYEAQCEDDAARCATLGPRADRLRARAITDGPDNPRLYLMAGIAALYAGPASGGGPAAAQKLLSRAAELFARDDPAPGLPAWGRAEAYIWLGQAWQRTGNRREARRAYGRALALEPDNRWVRDQLLPAVR